MTPTDGGLGPKPAFLTRGHRDQAVDPGPTRQAESRTIGVPMPPPIADGQRYAEIIDGFPGCPIAVYGGPGGGMSSCSESSPGFLERLRFSSSSTRNHAFLPGGAANAINNLRALEAHPIPVGILGRDAAGEELHWQLQNRNLPMSLVERDKGYPTPVKTRFVAGSAHSTRHQVLRLDREGRFQHSEETERALWSRLAPLLIRCRGIIVSDYGLGYVSPPLVARLAGKRKGLPITVDSRYQLLQFPGLTASTPNEPEVEALVGYEIGNDNARLEKAGRRLLRQMKSEAVLITRGRDGMVLFTPRTPLPPHSHFRERRGRRRHRRRRYRHCRLYPGPGRGRPASKRRPGSPTTPADWWL